MNKMAFKAFFITAFSQAERDGCRASDRPGPAGLDYFDFLSVKKKSLDIICIYVFVSKRFKADGIPGQNPVCAPHTGQYGGEGVLHILIVNRGGQGNCTKGCVCGL